MEKICIICASDISFAGSSYGDSDGEICLKCKIIKFGDRADFTYISTLEPIRNSMGVII